MGALNIMEFNRQLMYKLALILKMRGQIGDVSQHADSMEQVFGVGKGNQYRFIGTLGFGGKIYYSISKGFWVDCYPEDLNDERSEKIQEINRSLDVLVNKSDKFGFLQH